MAESNWLELLEGDPLSGGLELDSSPALDDCLFEPTNMEVGLRELLLEVGPELPSPPSWGQGSREGSTGQHPSNTSRGSASAATLLQHPAFVPGGPTLSQSSLQGAGGLAGAGWGPMPGSSSQQHSDTGGAGGAPDAADSSGGGGVGQAAPEQGDDFSEAEKKRQARLLRNRENAHLSRQRKKAAVHGLEQRCNQLQVHNAQLGGLVTRLAGEVATLRFQLATICQQVGRPMPHIPTALPPPLAAAAGAIPPLPPMAFQQARPAAMVSPSAAAAPAAAVAVPMAVVQPKAVASALAPPTQQQAQQQSAAAARPKQPQQEAADTGTGRKRARTAGTFLAVFCLFGLFVGPFTLPSGVVQLGQPHPASAPAQALPGLPDGISLAGQHPHTGRSLLWALDHDPGSQALPALPAAPSAGPASAVASAGTSSSTTALAVREQTSVHDVQQQRVAPAQGSAKGRKASVTAAVGSPRGGQLATLWNNTLGARWSGREPLSAEQLEGLALQRLQELAPVALLLDSDDPSALAAHPLAASQAFPQLAGQLFASSGLLPPQTCRPVFELDAASLPAAPRSRRSIERLLLGTLGMRGRSMLPAAMAPQPDATARAGVSHEVLRGQEAGAQQERLGGEWQQLEEGVRGRRAAEGVQVEEGEGEEAASLRLASPGEGEPPVLVSVLLPTKASGSWPKGSSIGAGAGPATAAGAVLASMSKFFVVMLHPRQRYSIHECSLSTLG